jgi:cysteine synthase A
LASSALAHQRHTGPELWEQSGGTIDVFVDFVGSGGSYGGIMRYFAEAAPHVRGYVVEPEGAAALAGEEVVRPNHPIQGGGYGRSSLTLLEGAPVHGHLTVSDDEVREGCQVLAATEGIFGGFSSGANLAAALQVLRGPEAGATVAMLVCDSGLKYLSTDLYP